MKAKLFDGTVITFSGKDVKSIDIEYDDYSILITFDKLYKKETGYTTVRAESISL